MLPRKCLILWRWGGFYSAGDVLGPFYGAFAGCITMLANDCLILVAYMSVEVVRCCCAGRAACLSSDGQKTMGVCAWGVNAGS